MRVAVVGGGISGLALAERLAARGLEPLVLESAPRLGGKIATRSEDGFLLETGPNGFLDAAPATLALAERVGLSPKLRPATPAANRRWLYLRGKLREVPTRPPAFLRSDILPLGAKLRLGLEIFAGRATEEDESIASFGRRHLGRRATRDLLGAMVLGIHAGDIEDLSLPACFPRMAALEKEHRSLILGMIRRGRGGAPTGTLTSTEGGLGALVEALGAHLGEAVRTGARVEEIRRDGVGFRLAVTEGGSRTELRADAVVMTTPAAETARLIAPFEAEVAARARGIPYAPMAVVHLAWPREKIAHPLDGFGFLSPPHEGRAILGALFISSIFPWRAPPGQALFTVMVGGAVAPERARLPEEALVPLAVAELSAIVGAEGTPSLAEVIRWDQAIPQYLVGHRQAVEEVDARMARVAGLYLGGNAWKGIGINDCISAAEPLAEEIAAGGDPRRGFGVARR